jgi:hypothetical protein
MSKEFEKLIKNASEDELLAVLDLLEEELIATIISEEILKLGTDISDIDLYRVVLAQVAGEKNTSFNLVDWLQYWFGEEAGGSDLINTGFFFKQADHYLKGLHDYIKKIKHSSVEVPREHMATIERDIAQYKTDLANRNFDGVQKFLDTYTPKISMTKYVGGTSQTPQSLLNQVAKPTQAQEFGFSEADATTLKEIVEGQEQAVIAGEEELRKLEKLKPEENKDKLIREHNSKYQQIFNDYRSRLQQLLSDKPQQYEVMIDPNIPKGMTNTVIRSGGVTKLEYFDSADLKLKDRYGTQEFLNVSRDVEDVTKQYNKKELLQYRKKILDEFIKNLDQKVKAKQDEIESSEPVQNIFSDDEQEYDVYNGVYKRKHEVEGVSGGLIALSEYLKAYLEDINKEVSLHEGDVPRKQKELEKYLEKEKQLVTDLKKADDYKNKIGRRINNELQVAGEFLDYDKIINIAMMFSVGTLPPELAQPEYAGIAKILKDKAPVIYELSGEYNVAESNIKNIQHALDIIKNQINDIATVTLMTYKGDRGKGQPSGEQLAKKYTKSEEFDERDPMSWLGGEEWEARGFSAAKLEKERKSLQKNFQKHYKSIQKTIGYAQETLKEYLEAKKAFDQLLKEMDNLSPEEFVKNLKVANRMLPSYMQLSPESFPPEIMKEFTVAKRKPGEEGAELPLESLTAVGDEISESILDYKNRQGKLATAINQIVELGEKDYQSIENMYGQLKTIIDPAIKRTKQETDKTKNIKQYAIGLEGAFAKSFDYNEDVVKKIKKFQDEFSKTFGSLTAFDKATTDEIIKMGDIKEDDHPLYKNLVQQTAFGLRRLSYLQNNIENYWKVSGTGVDKEKNKLMSRIDGAIRELKDFGVPSGDNITGLGNLIAVQKKISEVASYGEETGKGEVIKPNPTFATLKNNLTSGNIDVNLLRGQLSDALTALQRGSADRLVRGKKFSQELLGAINTVVTQNKDYVDPSEVLEIIADAKRQPLLKGYLAHPATKKFIQALEAYSNQMNSNVKDIAKEELLPKLKEFSDLINTSSKGMKKLGEDTKSNLYPDYAKFTKLAEERKVKTKERDELRVEVRALRSGRYIDQMGYDFEADIANVGTQMGGAVEKSKVIQKELNKLRENYDKIKEESGGVIATKDSKAFEKLKDDIVKKSEQYRLAYEQYKKLYDELIQIQTSKKVLDDMDDDMKELLNTMPKAERDKRIRDIDGTPEQTDPNTGQMIPRKPGRLSQLEKEIETAEKELATLQRDKKVPPDIMSSIDRKIFPQLKESVIVVEDWRTYPDSVDQSTAKIVDEFFEKRKDIKPTKLHKMLVRGIVHRKTPREMEDKDKNYYSWIREFKTFMDQIRSSIREAVKSPIATYASKKSQTGIGQFTPRLDTHQETGLAKTLTRADNALNIINSELGQLKIDSYKILRGKARFNEEDEVEKTYWEELSPTETDKIKELNRMRDIYEIAKWKLKYSKLTDKERDDLTREISSGKLVQQQMKPLSVAEKEKYKEWEKAQEEKEPRKTQVEKAVEKGLKKHPEFKTPKMEPKKKLKALPAVEPAEPLKTEQKVPKKLKTDIRMHPEGLKTMI